VALNRTQAAVSTDLVHLGLGEGGLVDLVVPETSVAHDVDNHIGVEALALLGRELHDVHHRLHIVTVHVEDGQLSALATSVQYTEDRLDLGSVVNATCKIQLPHASQSLYTTS